MRKRRNRFDEAAITIDVLPKPSLKDRQRALREEAILDSAVKLIAEKGFASVTFEQIADEACVSKPTLYQHFRSKEDVVVHLTLRCMNIVHDRMLSVKADLPVQERLKQVLRTVVDFRLDTKVSQYADLAQHVLPIRHNVPELTEIENQIGALLIDLIEEAQAHTVVRNDLSAPFLCQILFSIFKDQTYVAENTSIESAEQFARDVFVLLGLPLSSST